MFAKLAAALRSIDTYIKRRVGGTNVSIDTLAACQQAAAPMGPVKAEKRAQTASMQCGTKYRTFRCRPLPAVVFLIGQCEYQSTKQHTLIVCRHGCECNDQS